MASSLYDPFESPPLAHDWDELAETVLQGARDYVAAEASTLAMLEGSPVSSAPELRAQYLDLQRSLNYTQSVISRGTGELKLRLKDRKLFQRLLREQCKLLSEVSDSTLPANPKDQNELLARLTQVAEDFIADVETRPGQLVAGKASIDWTQLTQSYLLQRRLAHFIYYDWQAGESLSFAHSTLARASVTAWNFATWREPEKLPQTLVAWIKNNWEWSQQSWNELHAALLASDNYCQSSDGRPSKGAYAMAASVIADWLLPPLPPYRAILDWTGNAAPKHLAFGLVGQIESTPNAKLRQTLAAVGESLIHMHKLTP